MTKVKICGLRTLDDIMAVNEAEPDYAGFIFVPSRRRYIEPDQAKILQKKLDHRICPVGVFVNEKQETIKDVVTLCDIHTVQLHGQESNEQIDGLRHILPGIQIIKAFRIDSARDMEEVMSSHADLVLLDHGIGGTGERFDWSLIRDCGRPFILAGGLSWENVGQAIRNTHPYAVDVSSSLETAGHKDPEKIRQFMEVVREL